MILEMSFFRHSEVGAQYTDARFQVPVESLGDISQFNVGDVLTTIEPQLERFTNLGSGWSLLRITKCTVIIGQYRPLAGSSHIETPPEIVAKQAIINVNNNDNECFRWAVLSAVFPADVNANRVSNYTPYIDKLDFSGLKFPVTLSQIRHFERCNPTLRVNVYKFKKDENSVIPIYISKFGIREKQIDLLLLMDGDKTHFTWIKNMSALVAGRTKAKSKTYVCPHCVHPYSNQKTFENHLPQCSQNKRQIITFPDDDHNILKWRSKSKTEYHPFVIYCDFESSLSPVDDTSNKSTRVVNEHIPSGFCAFTYSQYSKHQTPPTLYSGPDCMEVFFDHLMREQRRIAFILGEDFEMLPLTREEQARFEASTHCNCCGKEYSDDNRKVRHHDHRTGLFVEALCNSCNLQIKPRKRRCIWESKMNKKSGGRRRGGDDDGDECGYTFFVPCVFHNLSNYDSHHIFRHFNSRIAERLDKNCIGKAADPVEIIGLNLEKYISFEILYLRFIDSVRFLNASLSTLVDNLCKSCDKPFDKFVNTKKYMGSNPLLFAKGIFPYQYFTDLSKFNDTSLPPKEAFYSELSMEGITDEEYERAQKMWKTFNCKTFKDYHDLYLKTDVLLLADCFQHFRDLSLSNYDLDPAHFLTLPSLAWQSCLKYTDEELDLIQDPQIYTFLESAIRGGISVISHRYAKANNPYMGDAYDPSKPNSYLLYTDANNLYGYAMSQKLPVRNFRFLEPEEIESIDFCSVSDDSDVGYIIECDLHYPENLHDVHNDYPLAPESMIITPDMLSPYSKSFGAKHVDCKKLVPNLYDKLKYITHYRNFKLYVELGLEVTKIHRVLTFEQKAWMKPFIDFNTQKRQAAKSVFLQSFYKNSVNSCFGKTMENVRLRRNIQLVMDEMRVKKLIAKPQIENFRVVSEDVVLVDRVREHVMLDKPIYAGFTTLELSKLLMFSLHYGVFVKHFGSKARLLFTDTDSLTYHIETEDLYRDMLPLRDEFFDTSNYPSDHPLYSTANAKVVGKLKDECASKPAVEFVGLRSKMYSLLLVDDVDNENVKMTAKGVKRCYVENSVRHKMYVETLRSRQCTYATFQNIISHNHKLMTVDITKKCLSAYDDKRHICQDGYTTFAHGHYRTRDSV